MGPGRKPRRPVFSERGSYRENHRSASALCGRIDKSGEIDFLFTVVGKTKGILFIESILEFPIQTSEDWFPCLLKYIMTHLSESV